VKCVRGAAVAVRDERKDAPPSGTKQFYSLFDWRHFVDVGNAPALVLEPVECFGNLVAIAVECAHLVMSKPRSSSKNASV
jgi:hypothetical protein